MRSAFIRFIYSLELFTETARLNRLTELKIIEYDNLT